MMLSMTPRTRGAALLGVLLSVTMFGCSHGGGGGGTPPIRQNGGLAIVFDQSTPPASTSSAADFVASGVVLSLDGGPLPAEVNWKTTADGGTATGSIPVGSAGNWAGTVSLLPGDNTVEVSIAGTSAVATLEVVYNDGYEFGGFLAMTPDVFYVQDTHEVTALIALPDPDTDLNDVWLVETTSGTPVQVKQMTDDGNLANGDEIQGDRIFTARFDVAAAAQGFQLYRVVVQRLANPDAARSETARILATEHLEAAAFQNILNKQATRQATIEQAAQQGSAAAAIDDLLAELQSDPDVVDSGR
ncbi:MAG: hypothetical protein KDE27_04375, partial [Planctomycetes bacterium]|nr:hypothetical protein [Planctomycetota bacterium]